MTDNNKSKKDRKLGDEWDDWDGISVPESTEARKWVFIIFSALSIVFIVGCSGISLWLIYPRLLTFGERFTHIFTIALIGFSSILILWLALFAVSVMINHPISRWLLLPHLVNKLLSVVMAVAKIFNFPVDKITNSFLKVQKLFHDKKQKKISAEQLLLLLPRCLTKEINQHLRLLRDRYKIKMCTVGGGSEARNKIRELRPKMIIAVACERDLLSGFREVNTSIPVIGIPNQRPEGPCKNTCVDLSEIELTIQNCLI